MEIVYKLKKKKKTTLKKKIPGKCNTIRITCCISKVFWTLTQCACVVRVASKTLLCQCSECIGGKRLLWPQCAAFANSAGNRGEHRKVRVNGKKRQNKKRVQWVRERCHVTMPESVPFHLISLIPQPPVSGTQWPTVAGWPNGPLDPSLVKALARNMVCNGLQESVYETLQTLRRHDLAHYNSQ